MLESIAYAAPAAQPAQEVNPILNFLPLILLMIVFYMFLIRPQQKRQKELQKTVESLKKGDKVVTAGGLIGVIAGIQNDYIVLKVGDNESTKIEVLKSAVTGLRESA